MYLQISPHVSHELASGSFYSKCVASLHMVGKKISRSPVATINLRNIFRLQLVGTDAECLGPSEVKSLPFLGPDSVSGAGPLFTEQRVMLPQELLALSPKP